MKNFLEVFEEMARRKPDHIAMIDRNGARQMTLREMEDRIDSVAAGLQTLGFPKGSFLIICMGRCSEYIAAYFGAIKAGMAVVPVTPEYPQERIDYIREDCHSPFTITEDFFSDLPVGKLSGTQSPQPEDIVCMNYTSGSTGKPKGVYYSFRCISKNIVRAAELFRGLDRVVTAASATLSFAAMCHDCLAPLLMGGTVHILSDEVRKDVQLMSRYYEEHQICCGNISPGMLRYFGHTSCLKRVLTTGERVVNISSDQHEIWCVYGLTEAYTAVSYFKIDRPYENTPIGKPFGGVKIEILDSEGNEVPDGTEGEIHVTGYLADGYYGMHAQTQESFVDLGEGVHRFATRDLGYKNENGDIIYVNRKDWMVKINGQRVEPYEVEEAVARQPGVLACIVRAFKDESGAAYLCAYYRAEDNSVTADRIRAGIAKLLPPYMVPAFLIRLDQFPLTVSGKIDRSRLPQPQRSNLQREYAPPQSDAEAAICRAMEIVLGLERVGRDDDFYELGGDSLAVQYLLSIIDSDALRASDVAKGKTPAGIAVFMSEKLIDVSDDAACRCRTYPLTPYQRYYYEYWKYAGKITLGNTPFMLRFRKGSVSADRIAEAAAAVLRQHPAFSTRIFINEFGKIVQDFEPGSIPMPQITCCSEEMPDERKLTMIQPFELENRPLYRCEIFSTPEAEVLFMDMHHIISDAASQDIFERDLLQAIRGEGLPEDYYCSWLQKVTGESGNLRFAILPDASYSRLPAFDFEGSGCETRVVHLRLKTALCECREKAAQEGASLSELMLLAALKAMSAYNGCDRVSVNWIYSGRDIRIKNDMAGLLLSSMPVPADLSACPDRASLLAAIQEVNRHNLVYNDLSPGITGVRPVIDDTLTVNYIPFHEPQEKDSGEVMRESLISNVQANANAFYIIVRESGPEEGLNLMFKYNALMYEAKSIVRFASIFMDKLELGEYEKIK